MSSITPEQTIIVKTEGAAVTTGSTAVEGRRKCPLGDHHIHRDDVRQVWKECQEESFWYRALPLSVGSMAVTGGLLYNGIWKTSPRFGPFPKLVVAGILGFAVGKATYVGTCRSKMQKAGLIFGPESGKGIGPGLGGFGFGPGRRHCHHVCEECKKQQAQTAPAEKA